MLSLSRRLRNAAGPVLVVVLFGAALLVLHHELGTIHYRDVAAELRGLGAWRVAWGVVLTVLSYAALTAYDALGLRHAGRTLGALKLGVTSFIAYGFSHSLAVLGGGAVRYRLYSAWGLTAVDIATIVTMNAVTLTLGFLALVGAALVTEAPLLAGPLHLGPGACRVVGVGALAILAAYFAWIALGGRTVRFRNWAVQPPSLALSSLQLGVSIVDWMLAASVLYVLIPATPPLTFLVFLGAFLIAQIMGVISHVPGGLGVFDTAMVLFLGAFVPLETMLGALVAYRALYYVGPLVVAAALLAALEVRARRARIAGLGRAILPWLGAIVPQTLAAMIFVGGCVLLLSGATPAVPERLLRLAPLLPLPLIEASHLLGSVAGIALVILARGLQRRLDAAYVLSVGVLASGVVLSLLKGFDYEEATLLLLMLLVLLPCHRYFHRRARLLDAPLGRAELAMIALALGATAWLFVLSSKHVDYSAELWWQFALDHDVPRALRATAAAAVCAVAWAAAHLLRPAPPTIAPPNDDERARAETIVRRSPRASAHLALLGDKHFLFSASGGGFVMYGIAGQSWVAMGDPVAPGAEARELAWRFAELADRHDGQAVFYEVGTDYLPLYVDLGLTLAKIGEEARVDLGRFSLEGSARKGLRYVQRRLTQSGCTFEVVPAEGVAGLLPVLRQISDDWLAAKHVREKRFSLGAFDPAYLAAGPVAIARSAGSVVAFANLWPGADKREISVDLMRYAAAAPAGVMEYMFVELLLWSRKEGYAAFNLGMAPLAGLETHPLAPVWSRLGAFLFHHGEQFYNFQGLRQYKEKFDPTWEPRYLAMSGRVLPRALLDVATLVAGGVRGIVGR